MIHSTTEELYVGIDAHQDSLSIAVLRGDRPHPDRARKVANDPALVRRIFRKFLESGDVHATYEAGCLGFVLWRQLTELGVDCLVAAPSRIPVIPGEQRKTDRLDAERLAIYLRGQQLTAVVPPSAETEALRSLTRTRESTRKAMVTAKHHVSKFLLHRGEIFRETNLWTRKHRSWLRGVQLENADDQLLLEFKLNQLSLRETELGDIDKRILERVERQDVEEAVRSLRAYRGIGALIGLNFVAEIGDPRRFPDKQSVAAYIGLVPSERSSGARVQRGKITRAGSRHLRRLLVEAVQHYRVPKRESKDLYQRRLAAPARVRDHARVTEHRLVKRYRRLLVTKHTNVAKTAVARELVGHLWASIHPDIGLAK